MAKSDMSIARRFEGWRQVDERPDDAPPTVRQLHATEQHAAGNTDLLHRNASRVAEPCLCRSAGTASCTLMAREADWAQLSLPKSGEVRRVAKRLPSNDWSGRQQRSHERSAWKSRSLQRWLGRRPHVRGTAMNPIDHPHGGGEGRTKGGRHPVSPRARVRRAVVLAET